MSTDTPTRSQGLMMKPAIRFKLGLNGTDSITCLQQMGGELMAKGMGGHALGDNN